MCGPAGEQSVEWTLSTERFVSVIECSDAVSPVGVAVQATIAVGTEPLQGSESSPHGTTATFACAPNYALSHENPLECVQQGANTGGVWDANPPKCNPTQCAALAVPLCAAESSTVVIQDSTGLASAVPTLLSAALPPGGTLAITSALNAATDWLCWQSGTSGTITATCAPEGTINAVPAITSADAGTPRCGGKGVQKATWTDASQIKIAVAVCNSAGYVHTNTNAVRSTATGAASAKSNTLALLWKILPGGTLVVTSPVGASEWLCWTSSASGAISAACEAQGASNAVPTITSAGTGIAQCGGLGVQKATWTDAEQTKVAVIWCTGAATPWGTNIQSSTATVTSSTGLLSAPLVLANAPSTLVAANTLASISALAAADWLCWAVMLCCASFCSHVHVGQPR